MICSTFALSVIIFLVAMRRAKSRICATDDKCRLGTALCSDIVVRGECGYRYLNTTSFGNKAAAFNACRIKFGPLSTPVTPGDDAVNGQVFALCSSHRFFDLRRREFACNEWETSAGVLAKYLSWDFFEPNNAGDPCETQVSEDCAGFKYGNGNSRWHDASCTPSGGSNGFVAECVVCDVPPLDTAPTVDVQSIFTRPTNAHGSTAISTASGTTTTSVGASVVVVESRSSEAINASSVSVGGLSDAELGGVVAGAAVFVAVISLCVVLVVARRKKSRKEVKAVASAAASSRGSHSQYSTLPDSRSNYVVGNLEQQ